MNKTINILELSSELAHNRVKIELNIKDSAGMYEEVDGCYIYKEHIQDEFNYWYDYYYNVIDEL